MRIVIALAAAVLATAAIAQTKDWRASTGTAPTTNGFTIGNPAAKVKLVEYLSFTCGHCGHFFSDAKAPLHDAMVRNGSVQVETRAAIRDPFDLAAWNVARCGGPARFTALAGAIFAKQDDWMAKGQAYARANLDALKALPQPQQISTIADQSGLSAIGQANGVTPAALKACFANDAQMKSLVAMTEAAFTRISGTPSFEINGQLVEGHDWHVLEPKLRAAGAR